jgi:predicted transcriptional regulator
LGALQDIPYSHEAEERLLGAVLMRPDLFPQIAAKLGPDDFFITRHRYVWQAISDLASQRGSWEFLTVAEQLQLQGRLADVGGQPFLIGLTTVADSSYGETYAELIRAAAARRRLLEYSDQLRRLATAEVPVSEVLARCAADMTSIVNRYQQPKPPRQRVEVHVPPLPAEAALTDAEAAAAEQIGRLLDVFMTWATRRAALTPSLFLEAAYLWLVSVAVARRACIQIGGTRYFSRLWVLWVAITTRYAKSTGLMAVHDVVERAFPHMLIPNQSTPEALIAALAGRVPDNLDSLPEVDRQRIQAGLKFAAQRGLLIDEASSLLGASRKDYMHGLVELLLQTYDMKERLEFATKGQGLLIIRKPGLSILGATTPMAMARYVSLDQWETGETARYALLCPENQPDQVVGFIGDESVSYEPPSELVTGLKQLHEWLPDPPDPHQPDSPEKLLYARITPDALRRLDTYHKALQNMIGDDLDTRLHGNYGRLPAIAMTVALNLALSDWVYQAHGNRPTIQVGHAARAQQIVERWRASVHRLLPTLDETADSRGQARIVALLRNSPGMTARELSRYCGMKTRDMNNALAVLLESGEITYHEHTPPNGGRPTRLYRIL